MTIATIPVRGRQALLKQTIKRLLEKNGIDHVICIGDDSKDRSVCITAGAEWVERPEPIGLKWNAGFEAAKAYKPDYVLFVGSSDWVSDNWLEVMIEQVKGYGMIGKPDFMMAHVEDCNRVKLGHWLGYKEPRSSEPIGIGRLLTAEALDAINWKPFNDSQKAGLDYVMYLKLLAKGQRVHRYESDQINSLSITTYQWSNLHKWGEYHTATGWHDYENPREWLIENFPEVYNIF